MQLPMNTDSRRALCRGTQPRLENLTAAKRVCRKNWSVTARYLRNERPKSATTSLNSGNIGDSTVRQLNENKGAI